MVEVGINHCDNDGCVRDDFNGFGFTGIAEVKNIGSKILQQKQSHRNNGGGYSESKVMIVKADWCVFMEKYLLWVKL